MAPLSLEGDTLGERHRHYNRLLKDAADNNVGELQKINYDDNDIDNIMKIDIANGRRDVDYILEVLKGEDLLYVSRALKRSAWLVTEPQHAHIVNPHHLHQHLFPHMTTKAINKLMLHIRKYLKDEKRVKAFYLYNSEINPKAALKWLPNCPVPLILKMVEKRGGDIPLKLFKHLVRRSPDVLRLYRISCDYHYSLRDILKNARCMLKEHTDKVLDISDYNSMGASPSFGKKSTLLILKNYPDRIINKFGHYAKQNIIHLPTFVDYITKKEGIKNYLLRHASNGIQSWFQLGVLKYFLDKIPKEETLDLLKTIFQIDSKEMGMADVFYAIEKNNKGGAANVYRWYQYMPFGSAKYDIQKLIYAESAAEERQSILSVFLACAGQNPQNVRSVLQYYHDRHINEPYKFKIPFVNNLLDTIDVHKFDDDTWNLLHNLFHSMEVYIESDNDVKYCIDAIIINKVLRGENVPDIIEEKFKFNTLDWYRRKLSRDENEKLFKYLYNYMVVKLRKKNWKSETDLKDAVSLLKNFWNLLQSYKKEQEHYGIVVDMIKEILEYKKKNCWGLDLSNLYNMLGRWRRHLFSESLLLYASDEVCLNALKHKPLLVVQHREQLQGLRCNDTPAPLRLLSKLRIYWPHTLGKEWTEQCLARTKSATPKEHKVLVKSLYTLLSSVELIKFIDTHSPVDKTIHWSEVDENEMSLRAHIAKNMHLARPHLPTDLMLKYTNGDYLQYSQPSLNAYFQVLNLNKFREHIPILLDGPVSQQKRGIQLILKKLKPVELKPIFAKIWQSTTNCTIREILFIRTYELLCKARKNTVIKELWNLLSSYIDQLTHTENLNLYHTLHEVSEIPKCVTAEYYVKCYHFLKSFPASWSHKYFCDRFVDNAVDIMEWLDPEFVTGVLLKSDYDTFRSTEYSYRKSICAYVLCCKDEETQTLRYNQTLKPYIEQKMFRSNIEGLLEDICKFVPNFVFGKKMVAPAELMSNIFNVLLTILNKNDYVNLTSWKLSVAFIKIVYEMNPTSENGNSWELMMVKLVPNLGELLLKQLEEDLNNHLPLIHLLFVDACDSFFHRFQADDMLKMDVIELLLRRDMVETYLVSLRLLPDCLWNTEKTVRKNQLRRLISSHPSAEVKMHYLHIFTEIPGSEIKDPESSLSITDSNEEEMNTSEYSD